MRAPGWWFALRIMYLLRFLNKVGSNDDLVSRASLYFTSGADSNSIPIEQTRPLASVQLYLLFFTVYTFLSFSLRKQERVSLPHLSLSSSYTFFFKKLLKFIFTYFLAVALGMQDLGFLSRNQTHAPTGSTALTTGLPESPFFKYIFLKYLFTCLATQESYLWQEVSLVACSMWDLVP